MMTNKREPDGAAGGRPPDAGKTETARSRSARKVFLAGLRLLTYLERGDKLDRHKVRDAMTRKFGSGSASGLWSWKDACEAAEVASNLFLYRYCRLMHRNGPPMTVLKQVLRIAAAEPPQSARDEEQLKLQEFSSPLGLGFAAVEAAKLQADDRVLEPSAGTGTLAVMAWCRIDPKAGGLRLNELSERRHTLLGQIFEDRVPITRLDAEQLADRLDGDRPTAVVMNPPFSRIARIGSRVLDADLRHMHAAFRILAPGGRLVAITSGKCRPGSADWTDTFHPDKGPQPEVRWTGPVAGKLYKSRGTTFGTRLTVIDKPLEGAAHDGLDAIDHPREITEEGDLLRLVLENTADRYPVGPPTPIRVRPVREDAGEPAPKPREPRGGQPTAQTMPGFEPAEGAGTGKPGRRRARADEIEYRDVWGDTIEVMAKAARGYESGTNGGGPGHGDSPFVDWRPKAVLNEKAAEHPTKLVESAAMGSVAHRQPDTAVLLPERAIRRALLSEAQLESVLLAETAHETYLSGLYCISADWGSIRRANAEVEAYWARVKGDDIRKAAATKAWLQRNGDDGIITEDDADGQESWSAPVQIRMGWMLGDGTGAGKGRQVAAVIANRWIRGSTRALWISQSDTLIEDAQRDWAAIGGQPAEIFSLRRYRANDRVQRKRGILFVTYATLRSGETTQRRARLDQIIEWLAGSTDGRDRRHASPTVVFDESHAMANAAGTMGNRGKIPPSRQGLASMKLQNALPAARVLYVSATGASSVHGLSYANRLGLWGTEATPFEKREQFVEAMEKGGVAALELMSRDMKALGLYQARALANDGVEISILEHQITPDQKNLYDAWARAFRIIQGNLRAALEASNVTDDGATLNADRKGAAISRFESLKQRFFSHMLCAMKMPTVLKAIEADLADGKSAVVQLVSTGEALMNRRLAQIPATEWDDLHIDMTPREYVLEYLRDAFPVQLMEQYEDKNGNRQSRPVYDDDGDPVEAQEAVRMREQMLDKLATAPSLPGALDTLVQHFGTGSVAEISGRSKRVVRRLDPDTGRDRFSLESRPPNANLTETAAFQEGDKRILVFSLAGNTGRSYHADKNAGNTDRRHHYLLEAGWRPDQAIQGLGRTHRTHQASAPLFIPVTTDIKAERRFISTIASRLAALGAITRGQRDSHSTVTDSGGELFRSEDNFETEYAHAALRQFFHAIVNGDIPNWSERKFEEATGLSLRTHEDEMRESLPPMAQTLNRLLALTIDEQNELFEELSRRMDKNIEDAKIGGTYDHGVEQLRATGITVAKREPVPDTNAVIVELDTRQPARRRTVKEAKRFYEAEKLQRTKPWLAVNRRSGHAAIISWGPAKVTDAGAPRQRFRLTRPGGSELQYQDDIAKSHWKEVTEATWEDVWQREYDSTPTEIHRTMWLVCGTLLPLWHRLPESRPRVYRAVTDDGERLIGRQLNEEELAKFKIACKMVDKATGLKTVCSFERLLGNGNGVVLSNNWTVRRRSVMDEQRLAIAGPIETDFGTLRRLGCKTERIRFEIVTWMPNDEVYNRVIDRFPIVRVIGE